MRPILQPGNQVSVEWRGPVSYTHLRAHETDSYLVCRLLLEKKNVMVYYTGTCAWYACSKLFKHSPAMTRYEEAFFPLENQDKRLRTSGFACLIIKSNCKFRRPNKNPVGYSYYLKHYYYWLYCIYMPSDNEFVACVDRKKSCGAPQLTHDTTKGAILYCSRSSSSARVRVRGSSSSRSSSSTAVVVVVVVGGVGVGVG